MDDRKCDLCDAPAWQASRDLVEADPIPDEKGALWVAWGYESDKVHFRCRDHKRAPKMTYQNGHVWGGFDVGSGPVPPEHWGEWMARENALCRRLQERAAKGSEHE